MVVALLARTYLNSANAGRSWDVREGSGAIAFPREPQPPSVNAGRGSSREASLAFRQAALRLQCRLGGDSRHTRAPHRAAGIAVEEPMTRLVRIAAFVSALALASLACSLGGSQSLLPDVPNPLVTQPFPAAEIVNDEGGPVTISGQLNYTYPFFTAGVAQPVVILEDEGGFVTRDRNFLIPVESQVLGKITSDFYTSPFDYDINLPQVPSGTVHDVDQNGKTDPGIQVFAVAYWTNTFDDPYLERRDQGGGGWSSAYASTQVSDDRDNYLEVYGGKLLVYAGESGQGFPSGFGDDARLFTPDDPIVSVPQGWTLVDLDSDPFTFDRSREPKVDLLEPESLALDDFSSMGFTEAFDAMLNKFRTEYAFTEYKGIDWDAKATEFRPRFEQAEQAGDSAAYVLALRDFLWSIPDTHVGLDTPLLDEAFSQETAGGLGLALRQLDDGRVLVTFLTPGGPAEAAGVGLEAEVTELGGKPILQALEANVPWSSPFGNAESKRLQQLRYAVRFPLGTQVSLKFANPNTPPKTVSLVAAAEDASFSASSLYAGVTGLELPVEFKVLDNGYGYVRIYSFFDNELLTAQLWDRMMQTLNDNGIPGLVIDLRNNGGGNGFLADQMAAYFFDEPLVLGNTGHYDDSIDDFYFDPGDENEFIPPREELRYFGKVAVIVGPACASACEFFAYDMTLQDRAEIVGYNTTAGAGGSVEDFLMPEDISVRFTIGRAVDAEGKIHIEGKGVPPTIRVPFDQPSLEADLLEGQDVLLEAAIASLDKIQGAGLTPSGSPTLNASIDLFQAFDQGVPYLEQLSRDSYDPAELSQAGQTYAYTVPLDPPQDAIWLYPWCTASDSALEDNWKKIRLEFQLDGKSIPADTFAVTDADANGSCRLVFVQLEDWPAGEHVLQTRVTFTEALNDGTSDYPAGTHTFEYHVIVPPGD